jgi:hypothetical protein
MPLPTLPPAPPAAELTYDPFFNIAEEPPPPPPPGPPEPPLPPPPPIKVKSIEAVPIGTIRPVEVEQFVGDAQLVIVLVQFTTEIQVFQLGPYHVLHFQVHALHEGLVDQLYIHELVLLG